MDSRFFLKDSKRKQVEIFFILVSILFGAAFLFTRLGCDDAELYEEFAGPVSEQWIWAVGKYETWSSRVLVNFVWAWVCVRGNAVMALYAAGSVYIYLKALYLLFSKEDDRSLALLCAGVAMCMPISSMSSAGWVATFTSYYGPQACMLMAMVPIRKIYDQKKMPIWEDILYILSMIYAANAEQPVIVLVCVYAAAFLYFLIRKRFSFRILIMFIIAAAELANMLICPGNWVRKEEEIARWFPAYNMLDLIDKADLGISTTLHFLIAGGQIMVIVCCVILMVLVWKKYDNRLYRVISSIPAGAVILLGPLNSFFLNLFPESAVLIKPVDYYGAFNVASQARGAGVLQFVIFLFVAVCICVDILLLSDTKKDLCVNFLLTSLGVATRVMMGFSPTVYASSTRTYAALFFCLSAVVINIYAKQSSVLGKGRVKAAFTYASIALVICGIVNVYSQALSAFY